MSLETEELNEKYLLALEQIKKKNFHSAESNLNSCLRTNPRASQTLYLYGVILILTGKVEFGLRCISKAYELKSWVKDDIYHIPEALDFVLESNVDDDWIHYMKLRYKWITTGLDYDGVISSLLGKYDEVSFLEIGANDGISGDPLFKHVCNGGMKGIFIEPLLKEFKKLKSNYGDLASKHQFYNIAVSSEPGELELFFSARSTHTSADPRRNVLKNSKKMKSIKVEKKTLKQVFDEQNIKKLNILQIDTEGHEWEILKNFDLNIYNIDAIYIEFYCLLIAERVSLLRKLNNANYVYYYDGMNLLAVKNETFNDVLAAPRP